MDLGNVAPAAGAEWIGSVPHEAIKRGDRPQLPSDDPFYDPPQGFQHAAPGTVLRSRDVEVAFLGLIPQKFTATQLLYRTTDMHGQPEATVTTVIAPAERGTVDVTQGGQGEFPWCQGESNIGVGHLRDEARARMFDHCPVVERHRRQRVHRMPAGVGRQLRCGGGGHQSQKRGRDGARAGDPM